LFLTVDIPQTPLFKDSQGGIIIPQVPLYTVLDKFGGEKLTDVIKNGVHQRKRYWITKLPKYLILSLARLTKNHFFVEKNPTIVNFPVKNLELKDCEFFVVVVVVCVCVYKCVFSCTESLTYSLTLTHTHTHIHLDFFPEITFPSDEDLKSMPLADLTSFLTAHGSSTKGALERSELEERAKKIVAELGGTKYDLVANVVHDSPPGQEKKEANTAKRGGGKGGGAVKEEAAAAVVPGTYRVHVFNRASEQWYEVQDLHVQETLPQLITISESCVLIYEKKGVVGMGM
jgi:U4/U6.U5 tri-snRNP-associated protein 2